MISQQTAFEYAEKLQEFVLAGGSIEKICACEEAKRVVRKSYHIMANPSMPITVEQVEESIAALDVEKAKMEEVKKEVETEKAKLPVEEVVVE